MRDLTRGKRERGFTIIELLIVLMVITILATLLAPYLWRAYENARLTSCLSNLKNIGTALQIYRNDEENNAAYPLTLSRLTPHYIKQIPLCPSVMRDTYTNGYVKASDDTTFTVFCCGRNHVKMELDTDQPFYNIVWGFGPKRACIQ